MQHQIKTAENVTYIAPIQASLNDKIRYAAYVRVSSSSDEQLNSYSNQISYYIRKFKENTENAVLVDIYADEGISGTSTTKREDFNRMLDDCRKGKIDKIITKSITRFSRDHMTTITVIRELLILGISVYFESENIDTATMGTEFVLNLHGLVAQQSSKNISENARKGFEMRAKRGVYHHSSKPYGYDIENGNLIPNEFESIIVKQIYSQYLVGKGMTAIAKELTAKHIPTPTGNEKWHFSSIRSILKNERMIGDMKLQKKFSTDTFPIQKRINYGEKDMYYLTATHEPIISQIDFENVQILLEQKNSQRHTNTTETISCFSKTLRCTCGKTLRRKIVNHKAYWTCNSRDKGESDCRASQLPEREIQRAFIDMFNKLIVGKDEIFNPMLSALITMKKLKKSSNVEIDDLSKKIREIHEQSHTLNGLRSKGVIDSAFCISQQNELNNKLKYLNRSKKQLLADDTNDIIIMQTRAIIQALEYEEIMETFDELKFKTIVEKITAVNENEIIFHLINQFSIPAIIESEKR